MMRYGIFAFCAEPLRLSAASEILIDTVCYVMTLISVEMCSLAYVIIPYLLIYIVYQK